MEFLTSSFRLGSRWERNFIVQLAYEVDLDLPLHLFILSLLLLEFQTNVSLHPPHFIVPSALT